MQQSAPPVTMQISQPSATQNKLEAFFKQVGVTQPVASKQCQPAPPKYVEKPTRHHLVLSVYAYLKWQYMCYSTPLEVSAYGFSRGTKSFADLLYIEDLIILRQECSTCFTNIDSDAILEYYDKLADKDIPLQQGTRVWFHTHPQMSAQPSSTDTDTFAETFDNPDWSIMAILSQTNDMTARLKLTTEFAALEEDIDIKIDWSSYKRDLPKVAQFAAEWEEDIKTKVRKMIQQQPNQLHVSNLSQLKEAVERNYNFDNAEEWEAWEAEKAESIQAQYDRDNKPIFVSEEGMHWSQTDYFHEFRNIAAEHNFDMVTTESDIFFQAVDGHYSWLSVIQEFRRAYPEYILSQYLINNMVWCNGVIDADYVAQFSSYQQPQAETEQAVAVATVGV